MEVAKRAEKRLNQIKKITKDYLDDEIEELFTSLHVDRQALVTPVEPTWNQIVTRWYEEEYQGKEFQFYFAEPEERKSILDSLKDFIAKCRAPERNRTVKERDGWER